MSEIYDFLHKSLESGSKIKIKYMGGSQPGSIRDISVIEIKGNMIRARCYSSNSVKTFMMDKIQIFDLECSFDTESPAWGSIKSIYGDNPTVKNLYDVYIEKLKLIGWHIEMQDEPEYGFITLHRIRKNGIPLKTPTVSISYIKRTADAIVGLDMEISFQNERDRQRPWNVTTKEKGCIGTWSNPEKAFTAFIENSSSYR